MPETDLVIHQPADSAPAVPLVPPAKGVEPPAIRLTAQQQIALEKVVEGLTTVAVAKAAGVDRGTIYRWKKFDPNFMAALNRWRGEVQLDIRDRLVKLAEKATTSVENGIDDPKLGLRVLEKMRAVNMGPDSPIDPYVIFGLGLEDEAIRGPICGRFRHLSDLIPREQRLRIVELAALGIAIDDRRMGHMTPSEVLAIAGPIPELSDTSPALPPPQSEAILPDQGGEARPIAVKARVARYGNRGFVTAVFKARPSPR